MYGDNIVKHTYLQQSLHLCNKLLRQKGKLDAYDVVAILKSFARAKSLFHGRLVHSYTIRIALQQSLYVTNALIDMYMKCGGFSDACHVFQHSSARDVVTWNSLICGYIRLSQFDAVHWLWHRMEQDGVVPDKYTFVCILKACSELENITQSKRVHSLIIEYALESDIFITSSLVNMYVNYASIRDAQSTFDLSLEKNLVMWNALISGYSWYGHCYEAVEQFVKMHTEGLIPSQVTFVSILRACSNTGTLQLGMRVHSYIVESDECSNAFIVSALIDMYNQSSCLDESQYVFDASTKEDAVTWCALITGVLRGNQHHQVLFYYNNMKQSGSQITDAIYVCVLKACSELGDVELGKIIHVEIMACEFQSNVFVANALIDMYASCGYLNEAQTIFNDIPKPDIVSWNSLVAGYALHSHDEIFKVFNCMLKEGTDPDNITIICMLKGCSKLIAADQGRCIHRYLKGSVGSYDLNLSNSLINMYHKCGCFVDAQDLFNLMPEKDTVTWSTMIAGLLQYGHARESIQYFLTMIQEGYQPNKAVLLSVLKACADETALQVGKIVHTCVLDNSAESDAMIGNALIHMYGCCGELQDARFVFQAMPIRNQATWTSLISGFGNDNDIRSIAQHLSAMQREGCMPNDVTLVCLLSACSHIRLLKEGCDLFSSMLHEPNISLTVEHCNCMVDLLGRAEQFIQAKELLISMPFHLNIVGWKSLLVHCKTFGNTEVGRECFNRVIAMDPNNAYFYSLLFHMYSDVGITMEDGNQLHLQYYHHECSFTSMSE